MLPLAIMGGLALAGCAERPRYPLMTPIAIAGGFGYAEAPLSATSWEVSYQTPIRTALGYYRDDGPGGAPARDMAFDFAVWRASQIAAEHGYRGFRIDDRKSSLDVVHGGGAWDGPVAPYWGPGWRRGPYGWYGPDYDPPETAVQARITLRITLTQTLQAGDYDAADVIDQVRRRYPGAESVGP